MPEPTNGKINNKEIYERITRLETKLDIFMNNIAKICSTYEFELNKAENERDEIKDTVSNLKIKVWGMAGLIGGIMGFIGVMAGKFI